MDVLGCGRLFVCKIAKNVLNRQFYRRKSFFGTLERITLCKSLHLNCVKCFSTCQFNYKLNDSSDGGSLWNLDQSENENNATIEAEYSSWIHQLYKTDGIGHRIFLIQPDAKWIPKASKKTTAVLQIAEAKALVETLPNWIVIEKRIIPVKEPKKKFVFGSGTLESLVEEVRRSKVVNGVSGVFVALNMLSSLQQATLENLFGLPVYDRYMIVLRIFRDHARTKDAKLQIALAEIPYIRSRLTFLVKGESNRGDHGSLAKGSGETYLEIRRRVLTKKEMKIRNSLEQLKAQRSLLRENRKKKEFPVIAVVGYTNAGKTSIIKAMTKADKLEPKDQLFATLDVTSHLGILPNRLSVLYVDTVGFISDIPTNLILSFAATLEDVRLADLIVHVCDASHPDYIYQKETVHSTLKSLDLDSQLLENMIEIDNKIDLVPEDSRVNRKDILPVSYVTGFGIDKLATLIQEKLLGPDSKNVVAAFRVPMGGNESRWLYDTANVTSAVADENPQYLIMRTVMTKSVLSKFKHQFGDLQVEILD